MSNVHCRADLLLMVMMIVSAVCGVAWPCLGCCPACRLRTSVWDGSVEGEYDPVLMGSRRFTKREWAVNEVRMKRTKDLLRPSNLSIHQWSLMHTYSTVLYIPCSGLLKNVRMRHLSKLFLSINSSFTIRRTENSCVLLVAQSNLLMCRLNLVTAHSGNPRLRDRSTDRPVRAVRCEASLHWVTLRVIYIFA